MAVSAASRSTSDRRARPARAKPITRTAAHITVISKKASRKR
jgi:hypothetical protein